MSSLPPFVALRARFNSMERFVANVTEGSRKDCLELSTEAELIINVKAKFAVEPSTDGLVHLRSCYNNKYWCSESPNSNIIAAVGEEAVEDKSAWNCTLFALRFWDSKVSFNQAGTNFGVLVRTIGSQLLLQGIRGVGGQFFVPINPEYIVRLPRRVTFKSQSNEKYLRARYQQRHEYNEFSGDDGLERTTHYDVFYTDTGDIRVKSLYYDMYWRRSPNWIWADSKDATSNDRDTLFEVVKLGENLIALRNRGNNQFCKSLTTEGKRNCLNAGTTSVEPDARLIVGEPVVSRSIEVNFRLMDARIYHQKPLTVASVTVPNNTHLQHEIVKGLSYTQTQISTWNNTLSLTVGGSVAIKTGIPIISEGKFEVYGSVTESIEFGKSKDFSKQVSPEYRVPVPPMTKVIVKVIATEAKYDIPFSYIQTDLYPTGERVVQELDDGIYKGVESYDFHFVTEYEKL